MFWRNDTAVVNPHFARGSCTLGSDPNQNITLSRNVKVHRTFVRYPNGPCVSIFLLAIW